MTKRKRRTFTDEFKQDTVRLIRESGKTVAEIARDLDLSESAVRNWLTQAEIDEGRGCQGELTTAERQELQRLRRENKQLQMEREILKNPRARRAGTAPPARLVSVAKLLKLSASMNSLSVSCFLATTENRPLSWTSKKQLFRDRN
jgi:transposase